MAGATPPIVRVYARARLPSRHGTFEVVSFTDSEGARLDDVAIIRGDIAGATAVPTRVHSECLTGDVFGSLRCDCRDQLELALDRVAADNFGLILYMRQEGRGIGIAEKVRAYELQDAGYDTLEANLHLGFDGDLRHYDIAAAMIHALEVQSIVLHTNNPLKVEGLEANGVEVVAREAILSEPRDENVRYLRTKKAKMGHEL
ncbi:GTP cyclohydrolase-2 [Enhygromyxa salina]|uniref:GTP cyclohydrolase-2 n=1 Tax=Enhygromyxa salina TaxID=215803 RepID=A0A2S9XX67_9BACT|nr:GTP cyclohydrolase II [Enhygromyxa salina]PRP97456.1 GTP cyclohydrolase-2 [Enhygromyxa salina]